MQLRFLLVLALFVSCNKDDDDKPTCLVSSVTQVNSNGSKTPYQFTYNDDGKLATIKEQNVTRNYSYNGNTIIVNRIRTNGSFEGRDSITLDNKGRALNIRQFNNAAGTSWDNFTFTYNGDELAEYRATRSNSTNAEVTTITYQNGNMVLMQTESGVAFLEYLTDKRTQPANYLQILGTIEYGVPVFPHRNLLKKLTQNGNAINFNHIFNDDGTIRKTITEQNGDVSTLEFTYQCD